MDALRRSLIGVSAAMERLRELVLRLAPLEGSVLIEGPTGSGKELVADALHRFSGRRGQLVAFNVCAIAESVFESTVYGHLRGAFTGAATDHRGLLLQAHEGTAFFDEIGDLSLAVQPKLLRAIETKMIRRVGGRTDERADFRVIAASNRRLKDAVAIGAFRPDLAERLRGFVIRVPPLQARPEDIPLLANHFLGAERVTAGRMGELSAGALSILMRHPWPHNVRELRNVIGRAALFADGMRITQEHVQQALDDDDAPEIVDDGARADLMRVLESVGWDTAAAAALMGVSRSTIYERMRMAGVRRPRGVSVPNGSVALRRDSTESTRMA